MVSVGGDKGGGPGGVTIGDTGDGPGALTCGAVVDTGCAVGIGGRAEASLLRCGEGGAWAAAAVELDASRTPASAGRRETRREERIRTTGERRRACMLSGGARERNVPCVLLATGLVLLPR